MRRERGRTSSLLCAQSVAVGVSSARVWICASRACAALAATRSATAARNGQGLLSGRAARQPRQPRESAVCRGRRPTTSCGRGPGHSARLPRRSPRKYTRRERAHRLRAQYRRERGAVDAPEPHWAETVFFLPFRDKKYFARTNDRTNASQLCQRTETTCGQGVESPF